MRWITVLLIWLGLASAAVAAELEVRVRTGPARITAGANGLGVNIQIGNRARDRLRRYDDGDRHRGRDRPRDWRHRRDRRILIVPVRERAPVVRLDPPAPIEPAPPVTAAPPEVKLPLDPLGQSRRIRARTAPLAKKPWTIGEPLPASLPHVTLAPGPYGLPELPPGEIYARVAGDLLRIDAATRRVVAEVEIVVER